VTTRGRRALVAALAAAGLVLLTSLALSVLGDVGSRPDLVCQESGGERCVVPTFDASSRTWALLGGVAAWVSVAVWLARPALSHHLRRTAKPPTSLEHHDMERAGS
jgi:hypothetical protein